MSAADLGQEDVESRIHSRAESEATLGHRTAKGNAGPDADRQY